MTINRRTCFYIRSKKKTIYTYGQPFFHISTNINITRNQFPKLSFCFFLGFFPCTLIFFFTSLDFPFFFLFWLICLFLVLFFWFFSEIYIHLRLYSDCVVGSFFSLTFAKVSQRSLKRSPLLSAWCDSSKSLTR